ncbi:hypothetical protein DORI_4 [Mycobacterium phage Dori]|uniref:hypothetical protein n=1 Tax=Mycobacterium phage Dori TaxID=1089121 RepID=UPI000232F488|nr:hypothetical protein DORI_4 [Mycobacterium phage Dori]AER47655.1 hypothetical protein DORI_4 [Mycobacterium phage Dori]
MSAPDPVVVIENEICAEFEQVTFDELVQNPEGRDEDGDYAVHTDRLAERIAQALRDAGLLTTS